MKINLIKIPVKKVKDTGNHQTKFRLSLKTQLTFERFLVWFGMFFLERITLKSRRKESTLIGKKNPSYMKVVQQHENRKKGLA